MLKISTKGDYGLLLLSALAEKMKKKKFVSLQEIAREKHMSLSYISQIILPIKKAGLVISKEGRGGGYSLAKSPSKITIMEILEILEGPIEPVRCCGNISGKCGSESYCTVKATWRSATSMLIDFLSKKTLEDAMRKNL